MPVTLCGLREVEIQIKGQERRVADHTAQRRPETAAAPDGERCASCDEQHDVQCVEGNTASPPERLPQHPEEISRTRKVGGAEVAIGQLTGVPRVRHGGEHVVIGPQRPGQVMRDPGCELQQREADKRPRQVSSEKSVRQELAGRQRCGVISPRHLVGVAQHTRRCPSPISRPVKNHLTLAQQLATLRAMRDLLRTAAAVRLALSTFRASSCTTVAGDVLEDHASIHNVEP